MARRPRATINRPSTPKQRMTRALRSTRIAGRPVSYGQWQRGGLARALLGKNYRPGATGTPGAPAPAPAAPAPAAPAAPAVGVPRPMPVDPLYDAQLGQIGRQRDDALAAATGERSRGLADYGYVEGPGGSLRFDVNNPFSKASLLKKLHDTQRRATGQTMGAGGQLYSGAYQNAQDLANRNQLQAQDSLQKSLSAFLARNTEAATRARTNYETQAGVLEGERVGRIEDNPLYEPTINGAAATAARATKAAGKTKRPLTAAQRAAQQRSAAFKHKQATAAKEAVARSRARRRRR